MFASLRKGKKEDSNKGPTKRGMVKLDSLVCSSLTTKIILLVSLTSCLIWSGLFTISQSLKYIHNLVSGENLKVFKY